MHQLLPVLRSHSASCRPAHVQEHQLRTEHSWQWKPYRFHTQATASKFSCPSHFQLSYQGCFPPSLHVMPFFTSVAAPWQAHSSDKILHTRQRINYKREMCNEKWKPKQGKSFTFILRPPRFSQQPNVHLSNHLVLAISETCMCVTDIKNATFTQVGCCWAESYCVDKGFPQQWQGQISGRHHTQTQGEASAGCQNCKRAEPNADAGCRGWMV